MMVVLAVNAEHSELEGVGPERHRSIAPVLLVPV